MSRIPEGDGDEYQLYGLQQANTSRQLRGKKGQVFLRELLAALEALPEKKLIEGAVARGGHVCSLGAVALKRRVDAGEDRDKVLAELAAVDVDPYEGEPIWDWATRVLAVPSLIAWDIPQENDDDGYTGKYVDGKYVRQEVTPEMRYDRMVRYVRGLIAPEAT